MQLDKVYEDLDQDALQKIAQKVAQNPAKIIGLNGTLGSGKSFFAKHFINSLQEKKADILSPSFNIALSYDTKLGEIFHFDLYRLKNKNELENIGFFDAIKNNYCLIEWPEIILDYLKDLKDFNLIEISIQSNDLRQIKIFKN